MTSSQRFPVFVLVRGIIQSQRGVVYLPSVLDDLNMFCYFNFLLTLLPVPYDLILFIILYRVVIKSTKIDMERFIWFTAPKYDLISSKLFGFNFSVMALIFKFLGFITVWDHSYPNHSILSCANLHFSLFNLLLAWFNFSSICFTASKFFCLPFATSKMSSRKTSVGNFG